MYEPSRIMSVFTISGFQYYDGPFVLDKLKPGKKLKMVSEPDNPYDPNAIALRYKGARLGYVPRSENAQFALMLYFGHADAFEVRVQQVNPEENPYGQVRVGVYVKDKR